MTETQRRIRAYQKVLPELRERVIAVALLLAMSASMLTSASFAWITLSRAPEVSGMQTTVAANGNLEIALASGEGEEPDPSAVGDSSAALDQTMAESNITWGNLVNLSDPVYGLNHIALRPALLNDFQRNTYPLYGATYGDDGRVISTSDKYMYSSWNATDEYFDPANVSYGVRAISSIKWSNREMNKTVEDMWAEVYDKYSKAQEKYYDLVEGRTMVEDGSDKSCIAALEDLLERFAQERAESAVVEGSVELDYSGQITNFYKTMVRYQEIMDAEGETLRYLANLQAYLVDSSRGTETFKTIDEVLTNSAKYGVSISALNTFKNNRRDLTWCLETSGMKELAAQCDPNETTTPPVVKWSQIQEAVNYFVNINTAELDGLKISTLSANDAGALLGIINSNSQKNPSTVLIKGGILKDTEQRMGCLMKDKRVMVSIYIDVTFIMHVQKDVFALVTTEAAAPFTFVQDMQTTTQMQEEAGQSGTGGTPEAKDTYGMAIDVWLRTNANNAVLTLEGEVRTVQVNKTAVNKNGGESNLYTMETAENGNFEVYELQEGSGTWYFADSHQEVEDELKQGAKFTALMTEEIVGYQGENRVWETWENMIKNELIEEDNTTQGSGSCFVFYANPTEQTNILDLLKSFRIAFLDEEGEELGKAILNTDRYYAINGKVTVPMEMISGTDYIETIAGADVPKIGITPLVQNEPRRITAVVYLDGMQLKNENVLASGEIQGRMNIQFGSSVSLTSVEDKELQKLYRTITAVASTKDTVAEGSSTTSSSVNSPIEFDYDAVAKTVTVTLRVDGEQPERISGFFIRSINNTQGTRADTETFTDNGDGTWTADFKLVTPGSYLLQSLIVDGVEYTLDAFPSVKIAGLNIARVTTNPGTGMTMTAASEMDVTVSAVIDTDPSLMPSQVRAVFRQADGSEINALMNYEGGEWKGKATFRQSGTYVLEYLVMDGMYNDVPENYRTTLIISLGMTSQVWADLSKTDLESTEFEYKSGDVIIPMQAKIKNNGGLDMRNLEGRVELFYHLEGSSVDQYGLNAVLDWDGEYYSGDFLLKSAGRYSFDRITITKGEGAEAQISTIRSTISSPEIVAIPPEPPAWVGGRTTDYQVEIGTGAAKISAAFAYADAAVVGGKVVDQNGKEYAVWGSKTSTSETVEIDGESVTAYVYDFVIPNHEEGQLQGTQNGIWELEEVYFQSVYVDMDPNDGDNSTTLVPTTGSVPTAEDSYVMAVPSDAEDVSAYVVATLETELTRDGKAYTGDAFGVDGSGNVTGAFMETHSVQPVTLTVRDWNRQPIDGVESATWTITYTTNKDKQSGAYGGYTANYTPQVEAQTLSGSEGEYTSSAFDLRVAGVYESSFVINLSNGNKANVSYRPELSVASVKPYIKFTATNPKEGEKFDVKKSGNSTESLANDISEDGYSATIYFRAVKIGVSCGQYASSITATLYESGNFESASCVVDSNGTGSDITFEFTASDTSSTQSVGSASGDTIYPLGKNAKATTLTIDGYTVTLTNPLYITNER